DFDKEDEKYRLDDVESYAAYLASQIFEYQVKLKYAETEKYDVNIVSYIDISLNYVLKNINYIITRFKLNTVTYSFHILILILLSSVCMGQTNPQEKDNPKSVTSLRVGSKVPNEFWTKEHLFYVNGDTIRKTLEEHKGKMVV